LPYSFFEDPGEMGCALHADANGDIVHRDVFMGHDVSGFFQPDRADEFGDLLVRRALHLLIQPGAADIEAVTTVRLW
jgi:hypothetical protein